MSDELMETINSDPMLFASYQIGKLKQYIIEEGADYRTQQQLDAWQYIASLLLSERDAIRLKSYQTKVYKNER